MSISIVKDNKFNKINLENNTILGTNQIINNTYTLCYNNYFYEDKVEYFTVNSTLSLTSFIVESKPYNSLLYLNSNNNNTKYFNNNINLNNQSGPNENQSFMYCYIPRFNKEIIEMKNINNENNILVNIKRIPI